MELDELTPGMHVAVALDSKNLRFERRIIETGEAFDGADGYTLTRKVDHFDFPLGGADNLDVTKLDRIVSVWNDRPRPDAVAFARDLLDQWRAIAQPLVGAVNGAAKLADTFSPSDLIAVLDAADVLAKARP